MNKKAYGVKDVLKTITTILSWTAFSILILIGAFLLYYVISANVYASRGQQFEPPISLYTIISPSMTPKIKVYDVIVNVRVKEESDVKPGDIITFISQSSISAGMTVTHRVIDKKYVNGEAQFITKGDNNTAPDSGIVRIENIEGKTIMKIPQLGRVQFLLATKMGWLFIILIPAVGVIIYDVLKLFKLVGVKKKVDKINQDEPDEEKKKKELERKAELKKKIDKTKKTKK